MIYCYLIGELQLTINKFYNSHQLNSDKLSHKMILKKCSNKWDS